MSGERSAAADYRPWQIFIGTAGPGLEQSTPKRFRPVKPVLLDTGVIVALLDRSEKNHRRSVEAVNNITQPLVTCEAVIAESCYLLRDIAGAQDTILENVAKSSFQIPF